MPANNTRQGLVTTKAEELLTWDWQPMDQLVQKVAKFVAPGKGLRKYQQEWDSYQRNKPKTEEPGPKRRQLTEDEKIYSGQKTIARNSFRTLIAGGRAEQAEIDGVKHIRFRERRQASNTESSNGVCGGCGRPFVPAPKPQPPAPPIPFRPKSKIINGVEKIKSWSEYQDEKQLAQ